MHISRLNIQKDNEHVIYMNYFSHAIICVLIFLVTDEQLVIDYILLCITREIS